MHLRRLEGGNQAGSLWAYWASLEGLEVDLWVAASGNPCVMTEGLLLAVLYMVLVWYLAGEASCLSFVVEMMVAGFGDR